MSDLQKKHAQMSSPQAVDSPDVKSSVKSLDLGPGLVVSQAAYELLAIVYVCVDRKSVV